VNRRTSRLFDGDWLEVFRRGKLPRPRTPPVEGQSYPPPDVYDLVLARELSDLRWRLEVLCVALTKPSVNGASSGQSSCTVAQGKMLAEYSNIWEFLSSTSWSDGTSRIPGSLSLKLTSGALQVTLTDPSTATYCCRSGQTLDDALASLELAFLDGSLGWRKSEYAKPKK
jgi:hypothetical protein